MFAQIERAIWEVVCGTWSEADNSSVDPIPLQAQQELITQRQDTTLTFLVVFPPGFNLMLVLE